MINDLDIVQWEYLLSPEFELINSAGKPLTGGWIEVYLHGTRDKYYCASDFDGTLHPFKIPLDSIGANVVLADPNNAYDVYVYNKFGSLIMSRYNVKCQGSGGSSTYVGDKLYYGQYRANNVTTIANLRRNKGNINITDDGYLKLKSGMSYHITVRGSFTVDDPANEDTTLNYIEYTSVNPIKIDIDETKEGPQYFELSYDIYRLQEDMDYQVAFAQSNGLVKDLIVEVHSLSNLATSAAGGDQEYEAGWGIDITNNVVSVDPSIFEDYTYTAGDYISIDENNVISVTGINPDDYATHDEVYEATVTAIEFVSGMIPEAQVQSDWNETDTEDPAYIKNKPDLDIYATHDEVNTVSGELVNVVCAVSSVLQDEIDNIPPQVQSDWDQDDDTQVDYIKNKPTETELVAGQNIGLFAEGTTLTICASATDLSDYATHDEVNTVSGQIIETVNNVSGDIIETVNNVSGVLHEEVMEVSGSIIHYQGASGINVEGDTISLEDPLYIEAGSGINFTSEGDTIIINADPIDLSDYATHIELEEAISAVTGMIPEAQVQSDWTEADDTDPAYIKNKPEEYNLVAGDNITIDVSGTNIVISSEGGIASGASGCTVEFVNILDYRGQITDREPGAQTTYTGGTALANAMRDIMLRGHMPLLVYGAPAAITEVFTPIWLDTREFAVGTNPGYSCVPLTGHEFFFKNPVTSFVTTKIVIDALNDKISDFIVSADTVATVGRGLTVDYFGAGDPWVWYEGQGPTPPASAATTPGLCRIEIASSIPDVTQVQTMIDTSISEIPTTEYTAGTGVDITSGVISVDNTVAMKTDLPVISLNGSDQVTAIDGHTLAGGGSADSDIFIANVYSDAWNGSTYNNTINTTLTTPYSDVLNAYNQGKTLLCRYYVYNSNSQIYELRSVINFGQMQNSGTAFQFIGRASGMVILRVDYSSSRIDAMHSSAQADWNNTYSGEPGYIKNKPSIPVVELNSSDQVTAIDGHTLAGGGGSGATYTAGDHISIENDEIAVTGITELVAGNAITITTSGASAIISSTGEAQVQANWNETDTSSKAYIQNKPTIPAAQVQSNWNETNTSSKAYIKNKPTIHNYTGASGIDITNDTISLDNPVGLVAGNNITIEVSGVSAIISSTGGGGGSSYTAGTGIDITSDVISVDNTVAMKTDIPTVPSAGNMLSVTNDTIDVTTTAGITDIQLVNALPASPVSSVLYLIPET